MIYKHGHACYNNIGRIFRKHNIIEYKSPKDYLSIDDFYKVYGYTCFYKSDADAADKIPAEELTITFVSSRYPHKLMKHLKKKRGYTVEKAAAGIYYIKGDYFPIQMIVTPQLSETENLWLKNLTDNMKTSESARKLIEDYGKHRENDLYQSVMDIIMQANEEKFVEVRGMCNALRELMKDEIKEELESARREGIQIVIENCKEFHCSYEETVSKITEKYRLSADDVAEYMKNFW